MLNLRDFAMISLGGLLTFVGFLGLGYYGNYVADERVKYQKNKINNALEEAGYKLVENDKYSLEKL